MFLTICSLGICLLKPENSIQDAVQRPELKAAQSRDIRIQFEKVRDVY